MYSHRYVLYLVFMLVLVLQTIIAIVIVAEDPTTHGTREPEPSDAASQKQSLLSISREDFRPRYYEVDLPILDEARDDPEALWDFLTSPSTPFLERMAAAHRCGDVLPTEIILRVFDAIDELQFYDWGVLHHPLSSVGWPPDDIVVAQLQRGEPIDVLGHKWTPPDEPIEHPITWEEHVAAPWPWQVEQALNQIPGTLRASRPPMNLGY